MNERTATPTWTGVLPLMLEALESGTDTGRAAARAELARMAELADARNRVIAGMNRLNNRLDEDERAPDGGDYQLLCDVIEADGGRGAQ